MKYTPILKGKSGEGTALGHLTGRTLDRTFPIIEVPPIPTKFLDKQPGVPEGPSRSLQEHLDTFVRGIARQVPDGLNFAIDFSKLNSSDRTPDNPVEYVFSEFAALGHSPSPVLRLCEDSRFAPQLLQQSQRSNDFAVVRIGKEHCGFPTAIMNQLSPLLQTAGLAYERAGLLFDFGLITRGDLDDIVGESHAIEDEMPLDEFGFSSIAGTSMPSSVTMDMRAYSTDSVPRLEWQAYKRIKTQILGFGDYGVNSPDYFDQDIRLITLGGKARYTTPDSWMIVKGEKLSKNYKQFHRLAGMIRGSASGKGSGYSWGDRCIHACAEKQIGPGNLESWVAFTLNHHLTMVARQLASAA